MTALWGLASNSIREQISDFLSASWAEGRCHHFLITGEPGLGRTRLAREALVGAAAAGHPTRWIVGTSATTLLPLGAFAHLLPPAALEARPLVQLGRLTAALVEEALPHRPLVLVIDDAHALDELSVALVQRLVSCGSVSMVLTVPTSRTPPDGIDTLWKDGLATRVELRPLAREQADAMLDCELGGVVDSRTGERLWRMTLGNPRFLQELVATGRESGALAQHEGIWRWTGPLDVSERLRELVHRQWGELTEDERTVLEALALAEPLELEQVVDLVDVAVVAALERRGLLVVTRDDQGARTTLTQPLHAMVLRVELPETKAGSLRRSLVERSRRPRDAAGAPADAHDDPEPSDDLLRTARLVLDAQPECSDLGLLAAAASSANASLDHALAERLARAALIRDTGSAARLALHEAVRWQGRCDEAEELAAACEADGHALGDRVRFAVTRALNLFFGCSQVDEARAVLRAVDRGGDPCLEAVDAVFAFFSGRSEEAARRGLEVLGSDSAGADARAWAAVAASAALAVSGRGGEACAAVAGGRIAVGELRGGPEGASIRLLLAHAELLALWVDGRTPEAEECVVSLHDDVASHPESAGDSIVALLLGGAALLAGRPPRSVRWLSEAAVGFARSDPFGLSRLCEAQLAQARALAGYEPSPAARATDPTVVGSPSPAAAAFEPLVLLAGAWRSDAEGDPVGAVAQAREAAVIAVSAEQWAIEAAALHAVVCFGAPGEVSGRLSALADRLPSPCVRACAEHAQAAYAKDGFALDAVAEAFAGIGCALLAVRAGAQAARVHTARGNLRRAAASATRAAALARGRGIADTASAGGPAELTKREHEIAVRAAKGESNRWIADALVLSVRTVEAHLARSFLKLGVHRRSELDDALGPRSDAGARPSGTR